MTRPEFVSLLADLERACVAPGVAEVGSTEEVEHGRKACEKSAAILAEFDRLVEVRRASVWLSRSERQMEVECARIFGPDAVTRVLLP